MKDIMHKKRAFLLLFILLVLSVPLYALISGQSLTKTLSELHLELRETYQSRSESQKRFLEDYNHQHQQMLDVIKRSNELSLLIYTQSHDFTFDLVWVLKEAAEEYHHFNEDRRPYQKILQDLEVETDRYARLIEALRRLPPERKTIEEEIIPDSLLYRNDSLDLFVENLSEFSLEKEVEKVAQGDTAAMSPFILDEEGEAYRDSCIRYASELLKMYVANRDTITRDSIYYQEAYLRLKESYDYVEECYLKLQDYIFKEGQTSWLEILSDPKLYWHEMLVDTRSQYSLTDMVKVIESEGPADSSTVQLSPEDSLSKQIVDIASEADAPDDGSAGKAENTLLLFNVVFQLIGLSLCWLIGAFLFWLFRRIVKKRLTIAKERRPLITLLIGIVIYLLIFLIGHGENDPYIASAYRMFRTFIWLLIVIILALLVRVRPDKVKYSIRLYIPTIIMALVVIMCRVSFMPDKLLNFIIAPILLIVFIRQLTFCIWYSGKADRSDLTFGWISLGVAGLALGVSIFGYTFAALMILVWWYFQLAIILTISCLAYLINRYKEKWMDPRESDYRLRITYVAGPDKGALMFGFTWFYELVVDVVLPVLLILSVPFCLHLSLDVFDFDTLFDRIFYSPFVQLYDKEGVAIFTISFRNIILLAGLFFIFRYINKLARALWQFLRYNAFLRKHHRKTVRNNEINLSLGNSVLSVLIWFIYVAVVVMTLRIPLGSLSLVAGGLSAGIGLALKDILNNFIYGIQLMSGRLRVGDWIECDGVRGKVTSITYQSTQIETVDGTEMSFLNAALFGKTFNNLTKNNSYEFTKIIVGVSYGTDIQRVREIIESAMEVMKTKDIYGRDVVDPQNGIYVRFGEFGGSSVDIAVKQYVLVPERIGYVDRAKEVIYNALNENGITIPFPQCDVHLIHDDA